MIRCRRWISCLSRAFCTLSIYVGFFGSGSLVGAQPEGAVGTVGGDIMRGWREFHDKRCVECHAVWDQGGRVGPDLGRIRAGRLTDGQLAGVMWNHIPKMLGQMRETSAPGSFVTLSQEEMADLFALIFFVRQLDEPGDPVRGESILRAKGCSECHQTRVTGESIGPDLARWGRYANPIVWAQLMWEHAPVMEEAMKRSGIKWPKLDGADLVHIVAYVRSTGTSGEKIYLSPGSVARGTELFREKGCHQCHPGTGPDLAAAELPVSVGALASRMWNHSPSMMQMMVEKDVSRSPLTPQELADIVAYVLALGNVDRGGTSARGEEVFAQKGCGQCHQSQPLAPTLTGVGADTGKNPAPRLFGRERGTELKPIFMATAMWNHGEAMLARMTEAGLSWPVFNDQEMVDLLAYLNASESSPSGAGPGGR